MRPSTNVPNYSAVRCLDLPRRHLAMHGQREGALSPDEPAVEFSRGNANWISRSTVRTFFEPLSPC